MRVLVVGGGAREHALVRGLVADPGVVEVMAAPGNAGIAADAETLALDVADPAAVAGLAFRLGVDLVVVGPELPLVAGAADAVRAQGITCFGPSASAAWIEGSKAFAKDVMASAGVPTASSTVCSTRDEAAAALARSGSPYVVKDDGLASGKGVVVTTNLDEALAHAGSCGRALVEDYLDGPEMSLFAVTDGDTVLPMVPAQDFKRAYDGDAGPNTGGMGAYSPLPWAPEGLVDDVVASVLQPTVAEMARRGRPFTGLLYAGLALTSRGVRVVEFNARFGDPETQVVLARLAAPLGELLFAASTGRLGDLDPLTWSDQAAVTVVVAAEGYPQAPRAGDPVQGLVEAAAVPGATVLHAGTTFDGSGAVVSSGGRVLSVVGTGPDLRAARSSAYDAVDRISLRGSHHRTDIAATAAAG